MAKDISIPSELLDKLLHFLSENPEAELVNAYLYFIENKFKLQPVLYPKHKIIYQSIEEAVRSAEKENPLYREAEIKITFSKESVNDQTKKIYICPFSGKVFGDNTHPNPQDAIYDWVSKCPENNERVGGLKVKRFYVSEDPDVIKSYLDKAPSKAPITKKVFSSALSGKIFNTPEAVIEDFKKNYLRPMALMEVQTQNRYQIEESFIEFIQKQLVEDKVASFVEALADRKEFVPHVERWLA
ncbi:DUF2709 domain-containing protein [Criblamydia sequanensis]|uniref:Uncharacterized protein n=1 Tax=Candidatus Criblamydia sequanensis CRIB-18 TaxID=1437425 RepID=A0A090D005_9BACT|nr:DUF2709 domain-containing protein [Criblamydia sequanensis]CDR34772.1 Conserved hypothetical protein [Criblamydia sequanensis CRIB-18]